MKILYISYRYDPEKPGEGSSLDFEIYNILKGISSKIKVFRPDYKYDVRIWPFLKRKYKKVTNNKLYKYGLMDAFYLTQQIHRLIKDTHFDFIFTTHPNPMCFYNHKIPLVVITDTTFIGQQLHWPVYGKIGMLLSVWQESRVFQNACAIITFSKWSKLVLIRNYSVESSKISFFPIPAAIPEKYLLKSQSIKKIKRPLKILIVAREYYRKGVDIAIQIVKKLNEVGQETKLTVCGLNGKNNSQVKFVGPYDKSNDSELDKYIKIYKRAHLLVHPARFEAAGITPSEGAAFGVPTITNDVGGLGTTVEDGISGIVLPENSNADAYVDKILYLMNNPSVYRKLCISSRIRYEKELNQALKILQQTKHEVFCGFNVY